MPASFGRLDLAAVVTTIMLAFSWSLSPIALHTAVIALIAGILQLLRLFRWQGHHTVREPLLLSLHIGYGWIGISFLLLSISLFSDFLPTSAATHALSIGAMAGLIISVAARAALGHTNRPLAAGRLITLAIVAINLTAVARVTATLLPDGYLPLAGGLWLLSFLLFSIRYLPILLSPAAHQSPLK